LPNVTNGNNVGVLQETGCARLPHKAYSGRFAHCFAAFDDFDCDRPTVTYVHGLEHLAHAPAPS
jgi:hypothetical protein